MLLVCNKTLPGLCIAVNDTCGVCVLLGVIRRCGGDKRPA